MQLQPIQADETFQELTFPVSGIDSSQEFDRQPPQTTLDGVNVRAFESMTERGRGGSRPGLIEYIPMTLPGGGPVQSLNFVVRVDESALLIEDGLSGQGDDAIAPGGFGGGGSAGDGTFTGGTGGPGGAGGKGGPGTGPLGPQFLGPQGGLPGGGAPDSGDFIPDPSTNNLRRRQPIVHDVVVHRVVRKKGSGIRPTRNDHQKMNTPVAVDDAISVDVGGDPGSVRPTDNDSFLGQPFVQLERAGVDLLGGSLSTSGSGITFTVEYLPPSDGNGGTIVIPYSLMATGNSSAAFAKIVITVEPKSQPPYPPDTTPAVYTVDIGSEFVYSDGFDTLTVDDPLSPFDGKTIQFVGDIIFAGEYDAVIVVDSLSFPNPPFPDPPHGPLTGKVTITLVSPIDTNQWNGTVG